MSSGEQTCQHPPRECPRPPSALTQLMGEGSHLPSLGCPPTSLTHLHHLLRFAWRAQGLTPTAPPTSPFFFFSTHTLMWHLLHMTACGLPAVLFSVFFFFLQQVIGGKVYSKPWQENKSKTMQGLAATEMLELQLDSSVGLRQKDVICWEGAVILRHTGLRWHLSKVLLSSLLRVVLHSK